MTIISTFTKIQLLGVDQRILETRITDRQGRYGFLINAGGIGYKVFCSSDVLKKTSEGQELKLFTHLHVKEDAVELYGFLALEELKLFDILNEISGIGPKTALTLASLGSLEKLQELMENGKLPPEVKGIGPKKAQKIIPFLYKLKP